MGDAYLHPRPYHVFPLFVDMAEDTRLHRRLLRSRMPVGRTNHLPNRQRIKSVLVKRDPVRSEFIVRSHLTLRVKHHHLSRFIPIPGVVPASAHI